MSDGFIVRRGGTGAGLQALAPTITIIDAGFGDVTFTITNNDPEKAVIRYRIDDINDLGEIIELEGNATSTSLIFDGLDENTSYIIFVSANVEGKVKSEVAQKEFQTDFIDEGLIVMWFGQSNEVPSGWALCDGSNENPDLRNRFIIGAGDEYAVHDTGGSADTVVIEHTHTGSTGTNTTTHSHSFGFSGSASTIGSGAFSGVGANVNTFTATAAASHSHSPGNLAVSNSGSSGTNANLPPYHGLFFIIKEGQ